MPLSWGKMREVGKSYMLFSENWTKSYLEQKEKALRLRILPNFQPTWTKIKEKYSWPINNSWISVKLPFSEKSVCNWPSWSWFLVSPYMSFLHMCDLASVDSASLIVVCECITIIFTVEKSAVGGLHSYNCVVQGSAYMNSQIKDKYSKTEKDFTMRLRYKRI